MVATSPVAEAVVVLTITNQSPRRRSGTGSVDVARLVGGQRRDTVGLTEHIDIVCAFLPMLIVVLVLVKSVVEEMGVVAAAKLSLILVP
mmetsp:Transcript_28430/g.39677  ORF Transcript_28430/g.39677 Transcript_28430/m.39677 type:complete len:89 (-) Transcript_28430:303-569(-)